MTDVGLASLIVGISNIFGLCFLIFCVWRKYFSWIFLILSQGIWLGYTISEDKFDEVSALVIVICLVAFYMWRRTDFIYTPKESVMITLPIALIVVGCCSLSPHYTNLPVNEILFQILTAMGLAAQDYRWLDMVINC